MICTTIKKVYLDEIEAGTKKIEYRACKPFWQRKLDGKRHGAIIFLCGRRASAFIVEKIEKVHTPDHLGDVIDTENCYAIHLGGGYRWPRQEGLFDELA